MKSLYKILIAAVLLLSLSLSATSCTILNGLKNQNQSDSNSDTNDGPNNENGNGITDNNTNETETNKKPTDEQNKDDNNTGGNSDDTTGGNGDDNTGGNGDDTTGGNGDDTTGDGGDTFVPDMTKQNTIETTNVPSSNYSTKAENEFNKDLFYKNSYEIPLGDPSVFPREENGVTWFYVTGTTTAKNFEMWKTKNFTDWEKIGTVYTPGENFFGKSSFWAPQLYYDAEADWQYYLGESSENGKGLYILFFSARKSNNACALSVAFSKNIEGPYTNFVGTNKNGDYIDESKSLFEIEKLKGLGLYSNHIYGDLYKKNRSFIDASPFVDPETEEKYLYMVRNRNVDTTNDVWGVKMKDWVTPDYSTTTPLTSYGYTDIEKSEKYGYLAATTNQIDEGPFLYYKDYTDDGVQNGKYYLTFSIGGTSDKIYPVCQAMGDSPLGPFTKIQPEHGGLLNAPEMAWNIHGSGHHAFFEVNGELYVAYHSYVITSGNATGRRHFAFDKVEWLYNDEGQYIMRSNGPSTTIQPLPESVSGYTNVATNATVSTNVSDSPNASVLNDGIVALRKGDEEMLFSFATEVEIVLSFDEYVTARAIMIYNSYDYKTAFSAVDKIELSYRQLIDGRLYFGTAVIDSFDFNFRNLLIPKDYLEAQGESELYQLRSAGSAIVEFDEIEINSIKIYTSNKNGDNLTCLSEIVVLGKLSATEITDESIGYGGYTHAAPFDSYASYNSSTTEQEKSPEELISIDGVLNDKIWTDLATLTVIEGATIDSTTKEPIDVSVWGERRAKVYTYIGKTKIYFAFDVTDKNLSYNSSLPQGRSTCVEIYFTTAENTSMFNRCYSIRINPLGENGTLTYNLGVYVPNENGNEWRFSEIAHNVKIGVVVNGSVQTSKYQSGYDTNQNVGYTVEIEIDKILIGLDSESFRFTAAFVQDKGYDEPRMANTFIKDTHYVKPETWIVFTNKKTDTNDESTASEN